MPIKLKMPDPDLTFKDYWRLRMDGMALQLEAALKLIRHNGTRGGLAENLLRAQIEEFLPKKWVVGSGFILDKSGSTSRQVDILLYDCLSGLPIYQDENIVVLPSGTARIAIEVKSRLDSKGIGEAFDNIFSVRKHDPNIKGYIFGYDGVKAKTFADHVQKWLKQKSGDQVVNLLPEGCFNLGKEFVMTRHSNRKEGENFTISAAAEKASEYLLQHIWATLEMERVESFLPSIKLGELKARVLFNP